MMFNALMVGLAKRNHQVDVITHFPAKNPPPNFKLLIKLNGTFDKVSINSVVDRDLTAHIADLRGNKMCELLGIEEIQKLIKNPPHDPPYDLLVTEVFGANCFLGLGYVLNVPVVAVTTSVEYPWVADFNGNHDNLAVVPSYYTTNFDKFKFSHRLFNFLMRKYLSPDIPNIREVEKSIALLIVNRSPLIDGPKPVTPSMIEVSGLHLEENEIPPITPELQKWLNESEDGVVCFSFGSMVLIETLPLNSIKALFESFKKISPVRILMKIVDESKLPPGLPENVKTLPLIPQQAVLAHKNVRIFLTHGGLMGCQEALYFGVPMIGVPLFSDQPQNLDKFVAMNMAIKINYNNLTTTSLDEALNAVLYDPKYRENAKYYAKVFKDRPMKSMDMATFWIEYVIRNGNIMKSPALELSWWQLTLLDVYGFLLTCLAIAFTVLYRVTRRLMKKVPVLLAQWS
ncbi:UDP-glucuronosyltransferase 2A1-like [Copidosoma floridanum]|uniref:UDP-glucuronosyltransferase 2A1-like n=1 Tax=Copidosoma floridanum TaxID=29053 RepID=UPI000C6F5A1C|nr:UDP-glucuronosyltransferase 2A1-like [Copidosoma floridanum]